MNWRKTVLGDPTVSEINPRNASVLRDLPDSTPISFVPMSAVDETEVAILRAECRTLGEVRKGFTPFRRDDVILAKITPCMENGKLAYAANLETELGFGSTEFHVIRAAKDINPKLLYYFLRRPSFRSAAKAAMVGAAGQQRVPAHHLESLPISLPTAPREQTRIVEFLDQADGLRRQRAEADAKLARLLPALFRHHFGDPLRNDKNWSTELLTKICEPRQWPTVSQKDLTETGFTVYGANGPIGLYSEYNHQDPTVLITCRGATCGTINVSPPKCYVTGNAMALDNPDPDRTTNEFLEIYLQVRGLTDTITGAAQPQITRANLSVVNVFTPPMPLVERFSVQVRETKQVLAQAAASAAKLETLFQTLLHRAFTGELTASWREAHLRESVQEIARHARV